MPFTDHDGVRLHWDEQGAGTPVLLVMGATYSSAMWWYAVPTLAEHHRVIRFDNRGTGRSQSTKVATIGDMASDAVAVMDAAGVDRAHVWGVSLGGVVVIELALAHTDRLRSLVVGCSGILSDDKPRAPKSVNLLAYLPRSLLRRVGRRSGYGPACPPELAEQDRAVLERDHADRRGLIAQQDALRAYSVSPERVRTGLTMPLLVQHGEDDGTVPPAYGKELADTVPGARHLTYAGAGHNYILDSTGAATKDVVAFFDDVDGGAVSGG